MIFPFSKCSLKSPVFQPYPGFDRGNDPFRFFETRARFLYRYEHTGSQLGFRRDPFLGNEGQSFHFFFIVLGYSCLHYCQF